MNSDARTPARSALIRGLLLAGALAAATPARSEDSLARCMPELRRQALGAGITSDTFDRSLKDVAPDRSVLELLDYQPEFKTPIWDYLAALVDDERVADGRAMLERWQDVLGEVERRYGVDARTVVAVWGVESNFGRAFGKRPLVTSLATLSCFGRRQSFFRGELVATLRILQEGHVAPEKLVGSWAGAFGHTQFMPSTFARLAVDFDGDGRRDIVDSVPDALGSTANFLKRAGWRSGEPWGWEVRLPPGFDTSGAGRRNRRPLSDWLARGVTPAASAIAPGEGAAAVGAIRGATSSAGTGASSAPPWSPPSPRSLPPDTPAALLLPAGPAGPAFLVLRNFDAIYGYNAAESYALAIAHLSDRLRGGGPIVAPWPTDDPGLSRAQRRELQTLLAARGHEVGEIDGMIGAKSREAIRTEERRLGIEPTGRAGRKILDALRKGPGESTR